MLGIALLLAFEGAGWLAMDALLPRQGRMTRLWLGLCFGLLLMMCLPSLYAFFLRFTALAQYLAGGTALLIGGLTQAVTHLAGTYRSGTSRAKEPPVLFVLCLVLPLLAVMAYLQYNHTLRPVDGALYTGQSTYGDLNLHLGIATGLVDAAYPPEYTILPGAKLGYPFLMDALSASMYALGTPLRWAFILPGTLMSGLVFWGFILLTWRFTTDKRAVTLAYLLLFLNGGLGFIYVLDQVGTDPSAFLAALNDYYKAPANLVERNIRWANVIVDMMLPQRTLLAGWCMVIPALWLLYQAVSDRRPIGYFLLLGLWGGAMPMIHTHSFLALGLISAGMMVFSLVKTTGIHHRQLLAGFALYGGLAVLLAAPQLLTWSVPQTLEGGSLRFQFNWVNWNGRGLIDGYFWFWIKNVGPVYLALVPAALYARTREKGFAIGAGLVWLVAELILFQPNVYDNNKLFYVAFITLLPLTGAYLVALYDRMKGIPGRRLFALAFLVVSVLSGGLSLVRECRSGVYMLYDPYVTEAARQIEAHAPQDATFLTCDNHNNAVSSLSGRKIVCGTGSFLYYHGMDYSTQRWAETMMFEQAAAAGALYEQYNVDYIFISSYERANFAIDYAGIAGTYPLIYENEGVQIYAVSGRAREEGVWQ